MTAVDPSTVERLLGERFDPPEAECAELEVVALALEGLADEEEHARAVGHLDACPDCAAAVEQLGGLARRAAADEADTKEGSATVIRLPWYRCPAALALAAAASALLVVTAGLLLTPPQGVERDTAPGAGMVPKGGGDQLAVAVQRGTHRFTARPGDRLLEGDRIGLFYSAAEDGHLAVIHLDQSGATTLLFPAGRESSAAIRAGTEQPLPDGGVVEGGAGCEWLIAVFSEQPLALPAMTGPIAAAGRAGPGCGSLRIEIPDARRVRVFPVQR